MAQLKAAEAAIQSLIAQGVDTVFGIISTHMMDVYDSLYDHQGDIRFISTRHEHAAALMADGYARATGKPGVCFTSTGPGAANSVGGIGEAYFSSSPVLTLTSTAEEELYGRGLGATHEIKNQIGMFEAVTGWAHHVTTPDEIPDRIYDAFRRFQTMRPRPVAIEMPVDIQSQIADVEVPGPPDAAPPPPDPAQVEQAVAKLLSAKRLAIWAGTGVNRSGANAELRQLAETLGVPVVTSTDGKGAIPEDHPLSAGVFGGGSGYSEKPTDDPLWNMVESADTLLVVGSSLSHSRTRRRGLELGPNVIHIDIDPEMPGKNYEAAATVVGDARVVLQQINSAIAGKQLGLEPGFDEEARALKGKARDYLLSRWPNQMAAMEAIRGVTARDAVFMGDVAKAVHSAAAYCLPVYGPGTFSTAHWSGLGFAFPAAAGAKAGLPDRQVICLTGDGGFQFNMQELGTCIQYGLSPVVMVFNDDAWGVLRGVQRDRYDGRFFASDLVNPDFVKLAESYGANGTRVESLAGLAPALEDALRSDTLTLIDIKTPDGIENFS